MKCEPVFLQSLFYWPEYSASHFLATVSLPGMHVLFSHLIGNKFSQVTNFIIFLFFNIQCFWDNTLVFVVKVLLPSLVIFFNMRQTSLQLSTLGHNEIFSSPQLILHQMYMAVTSNFRDISQSNFFDLRTSWCRFRR